MKEILVVEPTEQLQNMVLDLERAGFRVRTCSNEEAGKRLTAGEQFDAVLINRMDEADDASLSKLAGDDQKSSRHATIAIMRMDQVAQLDPALPVDDFVIFPFAAEELLARVRCGIERRADDDDGNILRCGDLTIDQASYQVFLGSRPIELTYKEYELLRFLAQNQDRVCTRETLLNRVWGYDFYGGARTVDVHIRRVRGKIEDGGHSLIETVRNVGYRLRAG